MGLTDSRFRVVETGDQTLDADPKIVLYRLDPSTLDFAEISGSAHRLLGFPLGEWLRPRFWHDRIHPQDREAARAFFADWPAAHCDGQLQYRVINASGQTVWVHQIIEAGRDAQHKVMATGALMDIGERVSREADVAKALIRREEFFRIVAEELAPPVRAISVYAEMLERHLASQQDDVGSDYALGLRDGVQSLDVMLNQLVRATQSGTMTVEELRACLVSLHGSRRGS